MYSPREKNPRLLLKLRRDLYYDRQKLSFSLSLWYYYRSATAPSDLLTRLGKHRAPRSNFDIEASKKRERRRLPLTTYHCFFLFPKNKGPIRKIAQLLLVNGSNKRPHVALDTPPPCLLYSRVTAYSTVSGVGSSPKV